jgi:hypothetical protein
MVRVFVGEHEEFPVYSLDPVHPDILSQHPNAGFEVSQELLDEYKKTRDAWVRVQDKLYELRPD